MDPLIRNPAGRLYLLLGSLREFDATAQISTAWARIFNVDENEIGAPMAQVAMLIPQIDDAVSGNGSERTAAIVNRYRASWLQAAYPMHLELNQQVHNIQPGDESYDALGSVADYLAAVGNHASLPSDEEQMTRLEELHALAEDVRTDEELPEEVRHLILDRLSAVETALRHIAIGGPDGVQLALEALLGAALATSVSSERTAKSKIIKRVLGTAGVIWVVFTSGPTAQQSLEAWTGVYHELTAGPAQAQTVVAESTPLPSPPEPPPDQPPS
jgi:hypothetical protein